MDYLFNEFCFALTRTFDWVRLPIFFLCEYDLVRLLNSIELNPRIRFDCVRLSSISERSICYPGFIQIFNMDCTVRTSADHQPKKLKQKQYSSEMPTTDSDKSSLTFIYKSLQKSLETLTKFRKPHAQSLDLTPLFPAFRLPNVPDTGRMTLGTSLECSNRMFGLNIRIE